MQITVTGKHFQITEAIEQFADKKCERLLRFYDRIQQIEVLIDKPSREYEVEIITHVDHHDPFVGTSRGADLYACIDDVTDKLTRQLTEHKDKIRNRKHPN